MSRTPRAAKRLVNIYRMLRASVPDNELDQFVPPGGEEYQAVALLAAVLVSMPSRAQDMFTTLLDCDPGSELADVLAGGCGDIATRLSEIGDLAITKAGPYRDWVPAVSRFSFRLTAIPSARPGSIPRTETGEPESE